MTINKPWLVVFFSFCSLIRGVAHAQQTCDIREYATFVAYAQSLDPLGEMLGRRMIQCSHRDYRESSLYWLNFYYSMTGNKPKIPSSSALLPAEVATTPKEQAQAAALRGDNRVLTERVSASTSGYVDDLWVLISLARSQMVAGQYSAAFQNYTKVLRLKEDQDAAEIELLFAYIWADDESAATGKLSSLRRYEATPYIKQSLDRAEKLLGLKNPEYHRRDLLSLAYVQERDNRGYAAIGGRAQYQGPVDLEIEALQHQNPLESEKENVASVNLAKHWGEGAPLHLLTGIGYFSAGDDHLTGDLAGEVYLLGELKANLGIQRRQVSAFERAPPGERAGLMRDSVFGGVSWAERLCFSGALHREDTDALFEDYQLEVRLGALLKEEMESGFGFVIPITYRHRPVPSPDYRSYPHDARFGLGIRLGLSDGERYSARTLAVLESIDRDDYGKVGSYHKLLAVRIQAHLRYYFQKAYYNFFEGSAHVIEKMPGEKVDDRGSEFLLGIGVSQESH